MEIHLIYFIGKIQLLKQPYSVAMIGSTVIGFLAIPIYFFAGIFYRDEMAAGVDQK